MTKIHTLTTTRQDVAKVLKSQTDDILNRLNNDSQITVFLAESLQKHKNSKIYKDAIAIQAELESINKFVLSGYGENNELIPMIKSLTQHLSHLFSSQRVAVEVIDQLNLTIDKLECEVSILTAKNEQLESENKALKNKSSSVDYAAILKNTQLEFEKKQKHALNAMRSSSKNVKESLYRRINFT